MLQKLHIFAKFRKFQLDYLVDFEKCCRTRIYLQRSAPIQPKTSEVFLKFCQKIGHYPTGPMIQFDGRGCAGSCRRREEQGAGSLRHQRAPEVARPPRGPARESPEGPRGVPRAAAAHVRAVLLLVERFDIEPYSDFSAKLSNFRGLVAARSLLYRRQILQQNIC